MSVVVHLFKKEVNHIQEKTNGWENGVTQLRSYTVALGILHSDGFLDSIFYII